MEKKYNKEKKQEKTAKKIGQMTQQQDFSRGWLTQILKFNGLKPLQGPQKHGCHANGVQSFVKRGMFSVFGRLLIIVHKRR